MDKTNKIETQDLHTYFITKQNTIILPPRLILGAPFEFYMGINEMINSVDFNGKMCHLLKHPC